MWLGITRWAMTRHLGAKKKLFVCLSFSVGEDTKFHGRLRRWSGILCNSSSLLSGWIRFQSIESRRETEKLRPGISYRWVSLLLDSFIDWILLDGFREKAQIHPLLDTDDLVHGDLDKKCVFTYLLTLHHGLKNRETCAKQRLIC